MENSEDEEVRTKAGRVKELKVVDFSHKELENFPALVHFFSHPNFLTFYREQSAPFIR